MLLQESSSESDESNSAEQSGCDPQQQETALPPPDLTKLMAVAQALGRMQQQDDNIRLLLALRPHLSPERAKRTDKAD